MYVYIYIYKIEICHASKLFTVQRRILARMLGVTTGIMKIKLVTEKLEDETCLKLDVLTTARDMSTSRSPPTLPALLPVHHPRDAQKRCPNNHEQTSKASAAHSKWRPTHLEIALWISIEVGVLHQIHSNPLIPGLC